MTAEGPAKPCRGEGLSLPAPSLQATREQLTTKRERVSDETTGLVRASGGESRTAGEAGTCAETVSPDRLILGEGIRVVAGRIILVDILAGRLLRVPKNRATSSGGTEAAHRPQLTELARVDVPLGAVVPLAGKVGAWVAAMGDGLAVLGPSREVTWLAHLETGRLQTIRMNDAAADPGGRIFAGSMAQDGTPEAGRLWRLDRDGKVSVAMDGISVPNGPAFDRQRRLAYLADSARGLVWRMRIDPASGRLSRPDVFVQLTAQEGSPDGMTVDDDGRLWMALWGAGRVACFDPRGSLVGAVAVPARQPASVALMPKPPGQLWITSARVDLEQPSDLDGAVFSVPVGATAPPATAFQLAAPA